MSDLLAQEGSAYDLNINMFNVLQRTITGWPEENLIQMIPTDESESSTKRVILLVLIRDDDVISMGGTESDKNKVMIFMSCIKPLEILRLQTMKP
jgi:glucosamine-6-phosphate deaminase